MSNRFTHAGLATDRVIARGRPALSLRCFLAFVALLLPAVALAGPWLETGDLRLRHDLLLLADAGLLSAPLQSWPVPLDDIARDVEKLNPESFGSEMLRGAYDRVRETLQRESIRDTVAAHLRLAATNAPQVYRGFAETPREQIETTAGVAWQSDAIYYRLDLTGVVQPDDAKPWRGDGSYLGAHWGNWLLSATAVDRWWGPGWNGSLILSSNARPVPAVAIQRDRSTPFEMPVLNWLGPWQFTFMMGRLDGEATIPYAQLMGMRVNFKPTPSLEIGLSRTAQWAGRGRPDDLNTFVNLLLGHDNAGSNGITTTNEPGNQLAGYDFRWASPVMNLPYALYGQLIGEDQAKGLLLGSPIKNIGLVGLELWHTGGESGASGRIYMEYADTVADFYTSTPLYNTAYEHHIYTSGYRYYGRCLGHSMCGDGRMTTAGYLHVTPSGDSWEAVVRKVAPDREISPTQTVLEAGFTYTLIDGPNRYVAAVGVDRGWVSGVGRSAEGRVGLQWRRTF